MGSFRGNIGEFSRINFSRTFGNIMEEPVVKAISGAFSSFDISWKTSSISTETTINSVKTFVTF